MQDLYLREVTMTDAKLLLDWRNESSVRENSFHSEIIAYEEHVNWLLKKLDDPDEIMRILIKGDVPVGQIRLSRDGNVVEVSYSIDADWRGYGYGKEIIRLGEMLLKDCGFQGNLKGLVKKENNASRRVFLSLGYQESEEEEYLEYTKKIGQIVYIRADMNPVIATGHVMRCLSIADEISRIGGKAVFIAADEYPVEVIRDRGHEVLVLHTDWRKMEDELPKLEELIRERNIDNLLVDSYQVTEKYLQTLKEQVRVTYLDDLDLFSYPVHNVICYANHYDAFSYGKREAMDGYFLGMDYVPLRSVYKNCPVKNIRERVEKILLLSGGSDSCCIIDRMVEAFCDNKDVTLITVCGKFYEGYEALKKQYADYPNLEFYRNVPNLEEYIKEVDLAVSAGGTTLYELCAMGTPTISYSFADNQLFNVRRFAEEELIDYAGDVRYDDIFSRAVDLYCQYNKNIELRQLRSQRMQQAVDGRGAERIAKVLLNWNVT